MNCKYVEPDKETKSDPLGALKNIEHILIDENAGIKILNNIDGLITELITVYT